MPSMTHPGGHEKSLENVQSSLPEVKDGVHVSREWVKMACMGDL